MSTLESAIAFSLIILLLVFMITGPESLALESFECTKDGGNELYYMERNDEVISKHFVHDVTCYDTSPERFCTFLTGLSDNFKLIYGSMYDLTKEATDDED
ncbi:MAG: hypothetical protein IKH82_02225 [Clostridiales bacterium]|nr:hypothetical protein [Clostridiales bacterium]